MEEGWTYGISLTWEVARPQRREWHHTSLTIKLNGLLLGKANSVQSANRTSDRAEIARESKNRVILVDWAEVCILSVTQLSIVFEGSSDNPIRTGLVGKISYILGGPVPISPIGLIKTLTELKLSLSPNLVVRKPVTCGIIIPLSDGCMVSSDPFCKRVLAHTTFTLNSENLPAEMSV